MQKIALVLLICMATACKYRQSCSDNVEKELMGKWYRKDLKLNKEWMLINKDRISPAYAFDPFEPESRYFILHYFLSDCDKCIDELLRARNVIYKESLANTKYVFIATGPTKYYIQKAVDSAKFEFPVYYEKKTFEFKRSNQFPPADNLYNTMLVNSNDQLLLFGAYYNNNKAKNIIDGIIKCNK